MVMIIATSLIMHMTIMFMVMFEAECFGCTTFKEKALNALSFSVGTLIAPIVCICFAAWSCPEFGFGMYAFMALVLFFEEAGRAEEV